VNTYTYTVSGGPLASGRTISKSQSLTGSTDVTFTLTELSTYDAHATSKVNKIVVDFDDSTDVLTINRPLSSSTIPAISGETFKHVIQTDFTNEIDKHVYFTLYRDDLEVDVIDVKFTMFKPPIDTYENINLLKTDFFNNDEDNEKVLLTFINKNPEVIGMSLLDLDIPSQAGFDPILSGSTSVSATSFNVGFTTEYVHVNAEESNTRSAIQVSIADYINTATGLPKDNGSIAIKYRTRAGSPSLGAVSLPGALDTFYVPLTANSGFIHLSGYLNWNCGDLLKDVELSTQTITVPLLDIRGTRTNLADYYFTNVNTGVGTSMVGLVSGGYFMVDLYDITSCDTITTPTSTLTAFVNY